MKKLEVKPRKNYLLYVFGGILLTVAALIFCPIWAGTDLFFADWGKSLVNLLIAACLILYLVNYLLPKLLRGGNGAIHVLRIVEFVLLALIALGCVLSQFAILSVGGACNILGLCLLCRGVVEIFRAYYHQQSSKTVYPLWWLAVAIGMVILGTYLFVKPLFTDAHLLWVLALILLAYGLFLLIYGLRCKPAKKPKKESAKA